MDRAAVECAGAAPLLEPIGAAAGSLPDLSAPGSSADASMVTGVGADGGMDGDAESGAGGGATEGAGEGFDAVDDFSSGSGFKSRMDNITGTIGQFASTQ